MHKRQYRSYSQFLSYIKLTSKYPELKMPIFLIGASVQQQALLFKVCG